jgi:ketosteroid isomerase-like protein
MEARREEHPNVAIVRESLASVAAGDVERAMRSWEPGGRYHAFDAEGVESTDLRDVTDVMSAGQRLFRHHENEVIEITPIGDELVSLHLRVHATSRNGRSMSGEYLIVLSVQNGKIRWACDFIDSAIQSFLDDAWS